MKLVWGRDGEWCKKWIIVTVLIRRKKMVPHLDHVVMIQRLRRLKYISCCGVDHQLFTIIYAFRNTLPWFLYKNTALYYYCCIQKPDTTLYNWTITNWSNYWLNRYADVYLPVSPDNANQGLQPVNASVLLTHLARTRPVPSLPVPMQHWGFIG